MLDNMPQDVYNTIYTHLRSTDVESLREAYQLPQIERIYTNPSNKEFCYTSNSSFQERYNNNELISILSRNGQLLKNIPKDIINNGNRMNMYISAVSNYGKAILDIPTKYHSFQLYLLAVKQDAVVIRLISVKSLSDKDKSELYLIAVRKNGEMLKFIPDKYKTKELCIAAFNKNPNALRYMPKKYKTRDMAQANVKKTVLPLPKSLNANRKYERYIKYMAKRNM